MMHDANLIPKEHEASAALPTQQLDWKAVAGLLAGAGTSRGGSKWQGLRVVDTVFLGGTCKVERWIFTAKTGQAAAKKRGEGLDKLTERFTRFALANPHNVEQLAALVTLPNTAEKRVALTSTALQTLLLAPTGVDVSLAGSWLQCFLRPRAGANTYYQSTWRQGADAAVSVTTVSPLYTVQQHQHKQAALDAPTANDAADLECLQAAVVTHTQQLADFLGAALGATCSLQSFTAEFIQDDNSDLWLSAVQNTVCASSEPAATGAVELSAINDPSSSSNSSSVLPIIQRIAGGVYVSNVHAGSLRGLSAWKETAPGVWTLICNATAGARTNGSSGNSTASAPSAAWSDETAAGNSASSSSSSSFAELSEQRWQVTARSVLLALQLEAFLKGDAAVNSSSSSSSGSSSSAQELAKAWRTKDKAAQLELAAANPQAYYAQATVCGNCYSIVQKLEAIRTARFGLTANDSTNSTAVAITAVGSDSGGSATVLRSQSASSSHTPRGGASRVITALDTAAGGAAGAGAPRPASANASSATAQQTDSVVSAGSSADAVGPEVDSSPRTQSKRAAAGFPAAAVSQSDSYSKKQQPQQHKRVAAAYAQGAGRAKPAAAAKARAGKLISAAAAAAASTRHSSSSAAPVEGVAVELLARFAVERDKALATAAAAAAASAAAGSGDAAEDRHESGASSHELALAPPPAASAYKYAGKVKGRVTASSSTVSPQRVQQHVSLEALEREAELRLSQHSVHQQHTLPPQQQQPAAAATVTASGPLSTAETGFLHRSHYGAGDDYVDTVAAAAAADKNSSTEAAFLRAAAAAAASVSSTVDSSTSSSSSNDAPVLDALRRRLEAVESESATLKKRAAKLEGDVAAEAARSEKATRRLAQAQAEFTRALCEKDEDHATLTLQLQEQHSRALQRHHDSATSASAAAAAAHSGSSSGGSSSVAAAAPTALMAQLEQLTQELAAVQRKAAESRRAAAADKAKEVAAAAAGARAEAAQARALVGVLEDKATALHNQVTEAAKQIGLLNLRLEEAASRRAAAEAETEAARREIGVLRQAVTQSASLEQQQGHIEDDDQSIGGLSTAAVGAGSGAAAAAATSEARLRTLNNKVEYLKAQLASEQTLRTETEGTLTAALARVETVRSEARASLEAAEASKRAAVAAAQGRAQAAAEAAAGEAFALRGKLAALQEQVGEAMGSVALAKRQEEAARGELAAVTQRLQERDADVAKGASRADTLSAALAAAEAAAAGTAGSEAVLRRLDNERQYLRSQLESELTCKSELQAALERSARQLQEVKGGWQRDQDRLFQEHGDALTALQRERSDLLAANAALTAETAAASHQLDTLKAGYSKAREQLRAEQSALEVARAAGRRLQEALAASTAESTALKEQAAEAAQHHASAMKAAQSALDSVEKSKRALAAELRGQVVAHLERAAEAQTASLALRSELATSAATSRRHVACVRIVLATARWVRNRRGTAFSRWSAAAQLVAAEVAVRARVTAAGEEAGVVARAKQEEALAAAAQQHEQQLAAALSAAAAAAAADRSALIAAAEAAAGEAESESLAALTAAQHAGAQQLAAAEARADAAANAAAEAARSACAVAVAAEGVRQAQQAGAAAAVAASAALRAKGEAVQECEERWRGVVKSEVARVRSDCDKSVALAVQEREAALRDARADFAEEKRQLAIEAEAAVAAAVAAERTAGESLAETARTDGHAAGHAAASSEAAVAAQAAAQAAAAALAAAERRVTLARGHVSSEVAAARRVWECELSSALKAAAQDAAAVRASAVKLEVSKWEGVVREVEARGEAEKAAAYQQGVSHRDLQAQAESEQLRAAAERALSEVKAGARSAISDMAAQHEKDLDTARVTAAQETGKAVTSAVTAAQAAWEEANKAVITRVKAAATAEAQVQGDKDRRIAVDAARQREAIKTEKVAEELSALKTQWATEKRDLMQAAEAATRDAERSREAAKASQQQGATAALRARLKWEEAQAAALAKAATDGAQAQDRALKDLKKALAKERARAVAEVEANEREAAQATVQEGQEAAAALVAAAAEEAQQARQLQLELQQLNDQLTAKAAQQEAAMQALQAEQAARASAHSLQLWRLSVGGMRTEARRVAAAAQEALAAAAVRKLEEDSAAALRAAVREDVTALALAEAAAREQRAAMRDALVNHKREVLVDHKLQSAALRRQIEQINREREALETKRDDINRSINEAERSAKEVERELQTHGRQSAIGADGRINAAHQRKKKRLNEDLEELFTAIEGYRGDESAADARLKELNEARHQKEEEMKALERQLIEVLIEQQKLLLAILAQAAESESALDPVLERLGHGSDAAAATAAGGNSSSSSFQNAKRARAVPKAVMFNTLSKV